MGLYRAGFDVIGVDNRKQPRYPFRFVQADALSPPFDLSGFDLIWASPPCQAFSQATKAHRRSLHPDLIEPTRAMLIESGAEWVIENVPRAPLLNTSMLCGSAFGLKVRRHRHFETSFPILWPQCRHAEQGNPIDVSGNGGRRRNRKPGDHGGRLHAPLNVAHAREVMGIEWMTRNELSQAIPPAYSEYIGKWAMKHLGRIAA